MTFESIKAFIGKYGEQCLITRANDLGYDSELHENVTETTSIDATAAFIKSEKGHKEGKSADNYSVVFISASSCEVGDILILQNGDYTINEVIEYCFRGQSIAFKASVIPC